MVLARGVNVVVLSAFSETALLFISEHDYKFFSGNLAPLLSSSFVNHELIVVDTVMMSSWLGFFITDSTVGMNLLGFYIIGKP